MTRAASPFSPLAVLAVLAVGGAAFLLLLYAIGAGWDGSDDRNGGAHAASNGLTGFAGLARLLEARGHNVSLSRGGSRPDDAGLLVLTPPMSAEANRIGEIIEDRRYTGPTLLILPKWIAMPADRISGVDAPRGWVALAGAAAPAWIEDIEGFDGAKAELGERKRWAGMGGSGALPDSTQALGLDTPDVLPLVTDEAGDVLAGYLDDGGYHPVLDEAAGMPPRDAADLDLDSGRWGVVVVAEPDLLNNYGMADRARAALAERIVLAAMEGEDLPVVFDLTAAGLGQSENLLTLAFRPPFLAATLCLLLAALVIAWRALRRFGAPVAETPALGMGKRQLARNGAGLVERAKRLHLLGPPYAALVAARIASALGIREADPAAREAAIDRALAARGIAGDFAERAEALRRARHRGELLHAAGALHSIERKVNS
jgi:hypothetical protein